MKTYRITEMAEQYASHDMIQRHTTIPPLPDWRAKLLFAVLNEQHALSDRSELYTLVTSLVQLGMDTHDLIDNDSDRQTTEQMRSRQLKVLAGDYFSSRFYQLLAGAGQIDMVGKISGAVCEVNRLKVNLYTRMRQLRVTADDYFGQAVQLRSELYQHFASMLEGSMSRIWPELLGSVSRCEVALDELERADSKERFEKSWGYWYVLQNGTNEEREQLKEADMQPHARRVLMDKYEVRRLLDGKFSQSLEQLKSIASKLDSSKLISELAVISEGLLQKLGSHPAALNEMR
ncbi:heptaprenyl diphosphate synthase component 1 [Paenibacillus sp. HB172176]|uniref:heptaprenyl diphosphate synthase component 1 n=1 Tax=Paenibacillus sp. HB172176 TaxID=2493690 RepID=UPI00143A212B|nr:heptaprenyl diphosphate synthase component 1 [Paenibacillus sp. HB172176]